VNNVEVLRSGQASMWWDK